VGRKIIVISLFFFALQSVAYTQGDLETGLRANAVLQKFYREHPGFVFGSSQHEFLGKHGIKDTLQLPFFDDFSQGEVMTLDSLWTNSSVFINGDFPVDPPSIGVATFDGLDEYGNAYSGIDPSVFAGADTLTSQPLDLSSYQLSDSIYLSFFYQAQGYSYEVLETRDSLVLQFKNQIGAWVNVWSSPGIPLAPFRSALVSLPDITYLYKGFQFRFINYMSRVGNLKQWHLDYVYMNQGRSHADTLFEDQSVTYKPDFPFSAYTHMPWSQLKINPGKYLRGTYTLRAGNLAASGETFSIELAARDKENNQIGFEKLSGNVLPGLAHTNFLLDPDITLAPDSRDSAEITLVARIGDILGGNDIRRNDSSFRKVELANYYAYDDGTAETGYGLRNGTGSVAYGFELEKPDTLRAISVHFTQAESLSAGLFSLNVWQRIAPPGTPNAGVDELLYSQPLNLPQYTDSINGFYTFYLDTPQYISGKFYIGWSQATAYMINIGFDRNYRYQGQEATNPALFYNVRGKWEAASVKGTLMMRPHVGAAIAPPVSVKQPAAAKKQASLYPHPVLHGFTLRVAGAEIEKVEIFDLSGKLIKAVPADQGYVRAEELTGGIYLYRAYSSSGEIFTGKFIKQQN
jgi:hypothetical protein